MSNRLNPFVRMATLFILVFVACVGARADSGDPPLRAGRVSVIEGRLTLKAAEDQDWSEATVNYPASVGMSFASSPGTRAELDFGNIVLRLDGRTALTINALDERTTAIRLEDGSLDVRARLLFDGESIVVTANNGTVTMSRPGAYRVDAGLSRDPTRAVTFEGQAEIETARGREIIPAGRAVEANQAGLVHMSAAESTAIDDWASMRDRLLESSRSERDVDAGMPGVADLDRAGTWQETPDYGAVWYPAVGNDWEPYAYGQWVWVAPWGWTWLDNEPWGFAPFHYGRWVYYGGRWGWCPGERVRQRPVYAPALVGFVDGDPWRFRSRGVRPDRWVPLGPGEVYRPPYSRNTVYLQILNRPHVRGDARTWDRDHDEFRNTRYLHRRDDDLRDRSRVDGRRRGPIVITDPPRSQPNPPSGGRGDDGRRRWRDGEAQDPVAPGRAHDAQTFGNAPGYQPPNAIPPSQIPGQTPGGQQPNAVPGYVRRPGWREQAPQGNVGQPAVPNPVTPAPNPITPPPNPLVVPGAQPNAVPGEMPPGYRARQFRPPPPHQTAPNETSAPAGQPNAGPGNVGQGNAGAGNVGQGNTGQGNLGQAPGGDGGGRRGGMNWRQP